MEKKKKRKRKERKRDRTYDKVKSNTTIATPLML